MKLRCVLLGVLLTTTCSLFSQCTRQAEPAEGAPLVTFELDWRAVDPQFYTISIDSAGRGSYCSQPHTEPEETPGDPYLLKFTADPRDTAEIFRLAEELKFFQGKFDNLGKKVAQTGIKTLRYRDGTKQYSTDYNASTNPKLNELTSLFQRMSTTFELGRALQHKLRYDKLGLDEVLKRMEDLQKSGQLAELQAIAPVLTQIANEQNVMNVARQRAHRLLSSSALATK
ncbi:MAG TPA: hypothetical protein VMU24_01275 [Candidatus Acidoferrales bacterium]|nr:hypothetical protein [Candidatus Acidoferrales bacterium]